MSIWEALEYLNTLVDDSDPDTDLSQLEHLLQTAEQIRRDGHPRWFILTGLIHDLGKILCLWGEPQWAVVGDTSAQSRSAISASSMSARAADTRASAASKSACAESRSGLIKLSAANKARARSRLRRALVSEASPSDSLAFPCVTRSR